MKNKATSYGDYYKNTSKTPNSDGDDKEYSTQPTPKKKPLSKTYDVDPPRREKDNTSWMRKAALKRRLQGFRKAGK